MNPPTPQPDPTLIPNTGGVVLCGGKSTRMGTSKAWLPFGNEVVLQRVTRVLAQVVEPLVVVAAEGQELPPLTANITVVRDEFPELGPLAGIYSGLKALAERNIDSAYVTACDCPFLRTEFVRWMTGQLEDRSDIVILKDGKYSHVLSAVYRCRLFAAARELLDDGQLRPIRLCSAGNAKVLDVDLAKGVDPDFSSLMNLNTPEDYQQALARLESDNLASDNEMTNS